jgi:hypothetical protein
MFEYPLTSEKHPGRFQSHKRIISNLICYQVLGNFEKSIMAYWEGS